MAKRKNKLRGGWTLKLNSPNDRRAYKAEILNQLKREIEKFIQEDDDKHDNEEYEKLENYISRFELEAQGNIEQNKQWFFFTPEEVNKTKQEIKDCVNTDRKDFNDYVSDLKMVYKLFEEDWSSEVQDKIANLLHDLCPEKTLVAKVIPDVYEAEEALPVFDENLPVAVAEPIYDGGRKRKSRRRKTRSRRRRTLRRSR